MKILVCIKQVPQKDAPLKLNDDGTWIREDVSYEVNEPDAYALEEALRQKEKHGGEVTVITAGPPRASQVLREALAKGADRAIHLEDDKFVRLDSANTARAIAAAVTLRTTSTSSSPGSSPTITAARRPASCWPRFWASPRHYHHRHREDGGGLHLKRELEAGHYQFIDMKMPAVLTIQSGINKLRYATLIGIKQAKMKPMRKVTWAEVEAKLSKNQQEIERLYIPHKQKKTEMIQGSAGEAARKLVEYLKNEARVI